MKTFSLIAFLLAVSFNLYAQEEKTEPSLATTEYMVVTATKTDVPLEDTTRTVIVIEEEELADSQTNDLVEILKDKAGIYIAQTGAGPGSNTSLFVRGANSDYNLILIDGVMVNMPGGDYDLGDFAVDGIERIEIVKGTASVLYGPNAAASVINIITKKDKAGTKLSFSAGNYNTFHETVDASFKKEALHLSLYGSRLDSDRQLAINNKYYRSVIGSRVDYDFSSSSSAHFHFRWTDSKDNYPTGGAGDRFMTLDMYDPRQFIKNNELLVTAGYVTKYSNWQPVISISYVKLKLDYEDPEDGFLIDPFAAYYGTDTSSRYVLDWQNNIVMRDHLFTAGLEYQREEFSSINNFSVVPFEGDRSNVGLYLQDQWNTRDEKLFITGGMRVDNNSNYKTAVSPQFSIAYKIHSEVTVKGSIGSGFKAPTFWQTLGGAFATGNPDLKPEKVLSTEMSIEYSSKRIGLQMSHTIFFNRFYDLIEYEPHYDPAIPDYINVSRARSYGYELMLNKELLTGLSCTINYTYAKVERISASDENELQRVLLRKPEHTAALGMHHKRERLSITGTLLFVGKRVDLDYSRSMWVAERAVMPSYYLLNASAHYSFYRNFTFTLRLDNILNKSYEEIFGYSARGRTILAGIETDW